MGSAPDGALFSGSRLWREILQNLFKIKQNQGLPDGKRRGAAPYGRKLNKIRIKIIQKYFLWGVHRAVHSIGSVLRTEIIQKFRLKIIQKFIIKECTGGALLGESPLARNLTKSVQNLTE